MYLGLTPRDSKLRPAQTVGCHIITMTTDLISKFNLLGMDLSQFSLATVRMFYEDAVSAGYQL